MLAGALAWWPEVANLVKVVLACCSIMASSLPAPSRITIAAGNEPMLVDRAVSETCAAIRALDPSAQRVMIPANGDDGAALIRDAMSPNLFGDATVLIVTGVDAASDDVDTALRGFIAEPAEHAWLIVTHPGGVKGKNLLDALRAAGGAEIDCKALKKGKATIEFLAREVRSHKRTMTADAVTALYDAIGHDLRLLVGAISQLCSDVDHDLITIDDINSYFTGVAEVAGYTIADSVWDRRSVDAMRSLRWAMAASDNVGVPTVLAMASGLRAVVGAGGMPTASDLEVAKAIGVPPWKVRNLRQQWARWSGDQRRLAAAAVALADADGAVKGGVRIGSSLAAEQKLLALEKLVLLTSARRAG